MSLNDWRTNGHEEFPPQWRQAPPDPWPGAEAESYGEMVEYAPEPPVVAAGFPRGIDVSHYQSTIDWQAAAGDGIAFAIAKASEGTHEDTYFDGNWPRMREAGIVRGAYHYLRTDSDPISQAEKHLRILEQAGGITSADLPPAVDIEEKNCNWPGMSLVARATHVARFLDRLERALGVKPMIYTRTNLWSGNRFSKKMTYPGLFEDIQFIEHAPGKELRFGEYPLWVARYGKAITELPTAWQPRGWSFWQYSDEGSLPGIQAHVDLDVFNAAHGDLRAWVTAQWGTQPASPTPTGPQPSPAAPAAAAHTALRDDPVRLARAVEALEAAHQRGVTSNALVDAGFYAAYPEMAGRRITSAQDVRAADWCYIRDALVPRLGGTASVPSTPSATAKAPPPIAPAEEPVATEPPFAPPTGRFWPVQTGRPEGRQVAYRTVSGKEIGKAGRRFKASRSGGKRYHAGVDLFGSHGDPILACEDGAIVAFYHFYSRTNALLVQHDSGTVINYGEVDPSSLSRLGLEVGDRVKAGQQIAFVGRLASGNSMLHFETYAGGTQENKRWYPAKAAPPELRNPTKYLLALAAGGTATTPSAPAAPVTPSAPTVGAAAPGKMVRSSDITVGGSPFARWFNRVFQPSASDLFNGKINEENFKKLWDQLHGLTGRFQITINEFVAHFCIFYNEIGGRLESTVEKGPRNVGDDEYDAYFFERREIRPGKWKSSYNGRFYKGAKPGDVSKKIHNYAGDQLLAWKVISHKADYDAWNSQKHYPYDPPPETAASWTDERWNAVKRKARECDFFKFRGRGLNGLTLRDNYVQHADRFLEALTGKTSDEMSLAELDKWFLEPAIYVPAFRSFNDKWFPAIEPINEDPPRWADYGTRVSGDPGYGAGKYTARCSRLHGAILAAGYECR
jgi:lysozyme